MKFLSRIILFMILATSLGGVRATAQSTAWERLEKPYGGGVYLFATAPNGDILTGSEFNGVFRSTDNGMSWSRMGGGGGGLYVVAVGAQGEAFGVTDEPGGLWRTTDNGQTWQNQKVGIEERAMRFATTNTAGTLFLATDSGVYRSTNKGDTWTFAGLAGAELGLVQADLSGNVFAVARGRLFRTADNGAGWDTVGAGLAGDEIRGIALNEAGDMFALAADTIYRSTDHGGNFARVVTIPIQLDARWLAVGKHGDFFTGAETLGAFRISADGGTLTQLPVPTEDVTSILIARNGNVVVGNGGKGVYTSQDNGGTFAHAGLVSATNVTALAEIGGAIYAGTSYAGLFVSTDGGENWTDTELPKFRAVRIGATPAGTIVVAGSQGTAFRSTDAGASWRRAEVSFVTDANDMIVTKQGTVLIASNDGLDRSDDNGETWATIVSDQNVYAFARGTSDDIWASGFDAVYHSTDDGLSWQRLAVHPVGNPYRSLVVLPDSSIVIGGYNTAIRSVDGALTWAPYDLQCTNQNGFRAIDGNDGARYLLTDCGIDRLAALGDARTRVADWPPSGNTDAVLVTSGRILYAGGNRGLYRAQGTLGVDRARVAPGTDLHLATLPNPSRGAVALSFTLPALGHATLTVGSAAGETVARLVDGNLSAGRHVIEWNADGMPSGVYFSQVRIGDAVAVARIELVR
jgi:photosystem II stability/assembly factor-like uncharacterized protein